MGEFDLKIRETLFNLPMCFILLIVFILTFIGVKPILKKFRNRYFAKFLSGFQDYYNGKTLKYKTQVFSDLEHIESDDFDLRNRGLIRILEIGVGAGANLKFYPQNCRLIVVDPNPYFKSYFSENLKKFPNIFLEKFVLTTGEKMQEIPDQSVDVVVSTLVLCSVQNIQKVFQEVYRVLAPGGQFLFMEHVIHDIPSKRRMQKLLTKSGIWPFIFDGCCIDRNVEEELKKFGRFSKVKPNNFMLDHENSYVMKMIEKHVFGVAIKSK